MVVLYCHLHYSYSHLYLLVESHCTEGHVHKQQHLHYTLCSELNICPVYFLVYLLPPPSLSLSLGDTREPDIVSLSEFFWCNSWAVSVSFRFFFVSFIFLFSFSRPFLKDYITCMCLYAQFCALNSNRGMWYSFSLVTFVVYLHT